MDGISLDAFYGGVLMTFIVIIGHGMQSVSVLKRNQSSSEW